MNDFDPVAFAIDNPPGRTGYKSALDTREVRDWLPKMVAAYEVGKIKTWDWGNILDALRGLPRGEGFPKEGKSLKAFVSRELPDLFERIAKAR